jgi:hypothetical protein
MGSMTQGVDDMILIAFAFGIAIGGILMVIMAIGMGG